MAETSTRPYLIRALYEWCSDNGYRPYIAVAVDERTIVPREFVRNGEIVLNISATATNRLTIGNELIEFEARFSGVARQVSIPIENVSAIFAQENGHGMAFEVAKAPEAAPGPAPAAAAGEADAAAGSDAAGSDAAALPAEEHEAGTAAAPSNSRARRRPKLSAVPAPGEEAPKPARRKPQISAVPSGRKASRDSSRDVEPAAAGPVPPDHQAPSDKASSADDRAAGPSRDSPDDDGSSPGSGPTGRPHLKRVK
ncbi:MAG: hypothetical protein ABS56_10920 [Lautropia sp. SCN 69-89]|nr:MAG: hypothetical protein ABS56_10920 [Lautropia sp. SCN 69-89]